MAKLESLVKMINARIQSIYKTFKSNSVEYHELKSLVFQSLGDVDIFIREKKGKPIGISRSGRAYEGLVAYENEIKELWEDIKKFGTAQSIRSKNYKGMSLEEVRKKSEAEYKSKFIDKDMYEEIQEEIINQSKISRGYRDLEYWYALSRCIDMFHESGRNDVKYTRILNIFTEAKLKHEEWLRDHFREEKDMVVTDIVDFREYDMGENP